MNETFSSSIDILMIGFFVLLNTPFFMYTFSYSNLTTPYRTDFRLVFAVFVATARFLTTRGFVATVRFVATARFLTTRGLLEDDTDFVLSFFGEVLRAVTCVVFALFAGCALLRLGIWLLSLSISTFRRCARVLAMPSLR